jgi:hypothetical protein
MKKLSPLLLGFFLTGAASAADLFKCTEGSDKNKETVKVEIGDRYCRCPRGKGEDEPPTLKKIKSSKDCPKTCSVSEALTTNDACAIASDVITRGWDGNKCPVSCPIETKPISESVPSDKDRKGKNAKKFASMACEFTTEIKCLKEAKDSSKGSNTH